MTSKLGSLLVALATAAGGAAMAQTAPSPIVRPDRPDQSRPPERPQEAGIGDAVRPAPQPAFAPFVLREVVVAGATLPPDRLASAWRPYMGRSVDAGVLQQITDALAAAYAQSDYALYTVAVERQEFHDGILRVRVVEGRLSAVAVEGPGRKSLAIAYGARLQRDQPLRRTTLERYVSLTRDIPGAHPDISLETAGAEGAVRMRVALKPRPVEAALTVNSRGTAFLGRTQVQGDVFLNGLLRQGDQTRVTYATPTRTRLFQYYALQHVQPVGADGLTVSASLSHLRTRPKGTDILGHATAAGVQLSYPLQRSYDQDLYLTLGLDGVDNDNAFLGFTFADDRTRTLRLAAAFSRRSTDRLLFASAAVSQGLDALGARRTDPGLAELDFRKLNARAGGSFALGRRAALRLAGAAQWSPDRVPATEQFTLGGDEFGRGYEASAVAGDRGLAGSAEFAYAPGGLPQALLGSEAYAFVDAGKVWYRGRFGRPTLAADIASAGVGARARVANRVLLQAEATRALEDLTPGVDSDDWRGVFLVKAVF